MIGALAFAAFAAALALPAVAAGAPLPRIVSINPCIDAVLMRVADATQIAGISQYSLDPAASSIPPGVARRFRATSGTAEEVVALDPEVVLAGGHVSPSTSDALARLGVRLVTYDVPTTIAQSIAQVRAIAAVAGHPARGEALVAEIEAALVAARPSGGERVPALIWAGGGLVPGAATLPDDLLRVAGFTNLSATYGLRQWDVLPLEYLVARPPRVLFATTGTRERLLSHPVLKRLGGRIAVRAFPARLLYCGGPAMVEALRTLGAARSSLLPSLPAQLREGRVGVGWVSARIAARVPASPTPTLPPLRSLRSRRGEGASSKVVAR